MMENGYSLHFEKDTCKLYDSRKIEIGQVKMEKRNRSFPISFKPRTNIAMKVEVDDSWLWHRRFGHFNTYALKLLDEFKFCPYLIFKFGDLIEFSVLKD